MKNRKAPAVAKRRSILNPMVNKHDDRPTAEHVSAETAKGRTLAADEPAAGNVDKIRDILFGSQMRDYDSRFARLEERVERELSDMRDSSKKRFDSLEAFIKREVESLQSRLKTEREERSESVRLLSRDLKDLSDLLSKKISEMDDQVTESQGQIRADILQQSKDLSDEIERKREEISAALDRRFQQLRTEKTDRAMLAELLTEVALRLKNEFQVPTAAD